jgi:hypothetical protein
MWAAESLAGLESLAFKPNFHGEVKLVCSAGIKPWNKLSATKANSGQLEAALRHRIELHATASFRLGAGRLQVQILSPRSKSLQIAEGRSLVYRPGNSAGNKSGDRAGSW